MKNENTTTAPKPPKKKSIFRWGAIVPFAVICAIVGLYFHFFFDFQLRKGLEWVGYKVMGVEINIADIETSVFRASFRMQGLEITDSETPTQDSIKIGDIRFGMLWDALLRAKIVVNEAVIDQIEFGIPRAHPGKVKPPEPPSTEPGFASKQAEKLKEAALKETQAQTEDNVLGDVVALLGGTDSNAQLDKLQSSLPSKAMLEKFEADFKVKQKGWEERLKTLPQGKEIQALGDRLGKVKTKDFKSPQEIQQSLQEIDSILKDADAKYKQIQSTSDALNKDIKETDAQYKILEAQIKIDIKELENHFHIPKIDAKSLSRSIFKKYLGPYLDKANRYKALAEEYLPPKFTHKKDKNAKADDDQIQPHPRATGTTYEFGRPNSYPLVWIKRAAISSQAGTSKYAGNIKGEILDITTHQRLVGRPTVATIEGDFPSHELSGLLLRLSLDNTKDESLVTYQVGVASYALLGKELVNSPDVQIAFNKAYGSLKMNGDLKGLKLFTMNLENQFTKIDYKVSAKNEIADSILKAVFAGIPVVTLSAQAHGELPTPNLEVNSNLGPELQKGFERQLQAKIEEAKKKIQAFVDQQIGAQKARLDGEISKSKDQVNKEVQKVQAQIDGEKKQAESKLDASKKDAENQGKKKLEEQGKKALDDLKSKFGL